MTLNEITRNRNLEPHVVNDIRGLHDSIPEASSQEVEEFFKDKGWKIVGQGAYSIVLDKPNSKFVIKANLKPDPGFSQFALICHKYNNPHFPVISEVRQIKVGNIILYIYMIEKLRKPSENDYIVDEVAHYSENAITFDESVENYYDNMESIVSDYFKKRPKLVEAINIISKNKKFFRVDMHPDNFMMRGKTVVITDPLAP